MENKEKLNPYMAGLVNKSITKYIVMTIIGSVLFTIGFILVIVSIAISGNNTGFVVLLTIGMILMLGPGLALMGVGTPCWIAMGIQIKIARNKLNNINKNIRR